MTPVIISPQAEAEIDSIELYYETIRTGLGIEFRQKLQMILDRIRTFPAIYAIEYRQTRAVRIRNSQFVLYYVVRDADVVVIAVVHGARDDSSWKSRVD